MTEKEKKILFIATCPSDYVEMKRALQELKKNLFLVELLYICTDVPGEEGIVKDIQVLFKSNVLTNYFLVKNFGFTKNEPVQKKDNSLVCSVENSQSIFVRQYKKIIQFARKIYKKIEGRALNKVVDSGYLIRRVYYRIYFWSIKCFVDRCYRIFGFFIRMKKTAKSPHAYERHLVIYEEIIQAGGYDLVVLPEDVVGLVSPIIIKVAHLHNIPALILPYTICNQEEAFQSLKLNKEYLVKSSFSNRVVAIFFRKWCVKNKEAHVLRLPGDHIINHYKLKLSPPDPWMMNSGYANAIAVESERMHQYYLESGLPETKLRMVGAMYDDELANIVENKETEREKIYEQLGLTNDRPMLLIGGCPDQTKGTPPGFDFEDIGECMDFICEQIKPLQSSYHIVMRPHPNHMEIGEYFKSHGITVADIPTDKLIAVSDVYVAHASATIRWAISCGVPVINYDVFYFNFSDYQGVQGVATVNSKQEFSQAVTELSTDKLNEMTQAIQVEKNKWAMLDGKSTERIINLINELCALEEVPRTTH